MYVCMYVCMMEQPNLQTSAVWKEQEWTRKGIILHRLEIRVGSNRDSDKAAISESRGNKKGSTV